MTRRSTSERSFFSVGIKWGISRVIKLMKVRWTAHIACTGKWEIRAMHCLGNLKGRSQLENLGFDRKVNSKWIFDKYGVKGWNAVNQLRKTSMSGFCEHSKVPSDSLKVANLLTGWVYFAQLKFGLTHVEIHSINRQSSAMPSLHRLVEVWQKLLSDWTELNWEAVTGWRWEIHNKVLHNLHTSPTTLEGSEQGEWDGRDN